MADTAALTVVKEFTYRGAPEEWSNSYHLDNIPQDAGAWTALSDLVVSLERPIFTNATRVKRTIGHVPGTAAAIFEKNYDTASGGPFTGLFVPTVGARASGDVAAWIKWSTTQVNVRGKPIWLRSYYHDVFSEGGTNFDEFSVAQKAAFQIYANEWSNGMNTITHGVYRRAGPRGAVAQSGVPSTWLTTRTLEKRGRRKKPVTKILAPGLNIPPGNYQIN